MCPMSRPGTATTRITRCGPRPAAPLQVSGPLGDGRGRLAEVLHIVWILQLPAGPHVLAAQQAGLPARTRLAARPRTLRLFTDAASSRASLAELRSALHGTI